MPKKRPRYYIYFYIDTNIFYDYIEKKDRRNENSKYFINRLNNEKDWRAITSPFTLMELTHILQDNRYVKNMFTGGMSREEILRLKKYPKTLKFEERKADLEEIHDFFKRYENKVEIFGITKVGWERPITLMRTLNISAPDAIHVATALQYRVAVPKHKKSKVPMTPKAIIFVSNDGELLDSIKASKTVNRYLKPLSCRKNLDSDKFKETLEKIVSSYGEIEEKRLEEKKEKEEISEFERTLFDYLKPIRTSYGAFTSSASLEKFKEYLSSHHKKKTIK